MSPPFLLVASDEEKNAVFSSAVFDEDVKGCICLRPSVKNVTKAAGVSGLQRKMHEEAEPSSRHYHLD
ncbi:hypothetical protein GW17_00037452 [Ensete ventricosum]|nr:hypothetical protein GW17_00037452 [Ensete ventricosum]